MSEMQSVLLRVTIGDNLTCSMPDGNEVTTIKGQVRFENFTNLSAEVHFQESGTVIELGSEEAKVFDLKELQKPGDHKFTVHEVKEGEVDATVYGEGAIIIRG